MKTKKELTTEARQEQYDGKLDLMKTWDEKTSTDARVKNHKYLLELRKRIRNTKNYIIHRKDADAHI